MRWLGKRESSNVDDRRGIGGGGIAVGGGMIGIIGVVLYLIMGGDPNQVLNQLNQGGAGQEKTAEQKAAEDSLAKFSKVVFAYTEDVWHDLLSDRYVEPTLTLFDYSVQSACGGASSATGPFYCPADNKVYIDLSFFKELDERFGAAGDFAQAYVIAHEVGHHVQNLLGTSEKVQSQRSRLSEAEYNRLSVKLELQADFYAGVWAHHAQQMKNILEPGDIEEALNAASQIGDDRLTKGQVSPDAFTHGTSAQRMYWFKKGFETGDIQQGNTFDDPSLN